MLTVPGVLSSSIGTLLNGGMGGSGSEFLHIEGMPPKPGLLTARTGVMPGFFAAAGTPVIAGREFNGHDTIEAPRVTLINETMARFFFGNENPVGKRMGGGNESASAWEIVGVVKDVKTSPRDARGIWYVADTQQPNQLRATWCLILRTAGDPHMLANAVRQQLKKIDPAMPVFGITTFQEQLDGVLSQERLLTVLSVSFALMATLLASLGLYGMMAYATVRRTREFGIRIALGATSAGVRRLVLQESVFLSLIGTAIAIPLTIAGARAAASMLFGVGASDWGVYLVAAAGMMLVAAAAGIAPAHKASRVDPSDALRHE
jgi:hypothetical protein